MPRRVAVVKEHKRLSPALRLVVVVESVLRRGSPLHGPRQDMELQVVAAVVQVLRLVRPPRGLLAAGDLSRLCLV